MVPQCGDNLVECHHDCTHCGTDAAQFFPEPHVLALLHGLDLLEPGQDRRHRLLGVVVRSHDGAVCTANGIPRLKDRRVDSWVVMAWAYFCWRDGGGLVISSLSLTADVAAFSGGRVFGGLPVVGQNDPGGLPRRCYGGLLTGGNCLLPPGSE
ncbi:hypothetical protein NDU88_004542 [Pleurodeles waltl]|uniref:Uncharacterized protein n=1 Tax=Pleurodeles waltl TaxID=8319 RepID=A0AAV7V395_PLEWA|nr:hypothetical protein NDU88_004542 [Pleurodeles waltl]